MALALMHHLCIGRNLSFGLLAAGLAKMGQHLLIEFVPKDDPKVSILLQHREDVFQHYTETDFRETFNQYFDLLLERPLEGSNRKLFLYRRKIGG
jgi:hypothetical protein